jgi:hypothetical protein
MQEELKQAALDYHRKPKPGKLAIMATTPLANQRDLSLAYSPGVAFACDAIVDDPAAAAEMTARSNLVGVISNGTAVLGLGNIGPLAAKPVMEGKAVLFKKFAGIDVFDIEIAESEPKMFIETVARLEPTFGGINLEDIKAPDCFEIEEALRPRMNIPVFHDDQHGWWRGPAARRSRKSRPTPRRQRSRLPARPASRGAVRRTVRGARRRRPRRRTRRSAWLRRSSGSYRGSGSRVLRRPRRRRG